jgi:hypothetical protein
MKKWIGFVAVIMVVFFGCTHSENSALHKNEFSDLHCGYHILLPDGWKEVPHRRDVEKHVFWGFSNYHHASVSEVPVFRTWETPESEDMFLTIMEVKRHCNFGVGGMYNELMHILRDGGWTIKATGVTRIGKERSKWWVQSHMHGDVQQLCYLVGNGPYFYAFVFTAADLTPEKKKIFEGIIESVTFHGKM